MKKYIFTIITFILSIGCFVTYTIIGSKISAEGYLQEPFYLIPIGYFLSGIAIIGLVIAIISTVKAKKQKIVKIHR